MLTLAGGALQLTCSVLQPCVGPGADTTFESQAAFVFGIPLGNSTLWVYAGGPELLQPVPSLVLTRPALSRSALQVTGGTRPGRAQCAAASRACVRCCPQHARDWAARRWGRPATCGSRSCSRQMAAGSCATSSGGARRTSRGCWHRWQTCRSLATWTTCDGPAGHRGLSGWPSLVVCRSRSCS